jgi:glc operon protein GlcG
MSRSLGVLVRYSVLMTATSAAEWALRKDIMLCSLGRTTLPTLGDLMTIQLAVANDHIIRCLSIAEELRLRIAVVVVDLGGHTVAAQRMDGVGYINMEVARRKANAAAQFKTPLDAFSEMLAKNPLIASSMMASSDDIIVLPGGFPIVHVMTVVGGLGIAGGHYEQDHEVGRRAMRDVAELAAGGSK